MIHDLVVEGNLVDVHQITHRQIGISDGIISEIARHGVEGEHTLAVDDCLIFPGFIDIHTHLREPGWTYKEDFVTGTRAAIHGGITCLVDMPNLPDPTTNVRKILEKKALASERGRIEILLYAGVTEANMLSLKTMAEHVAGFKIFTAESTGDLYVPYSGLGDASSEISKTGKPLSVHAEDQSINESRKQELKNRLDPKVHCDARPPLSEIRAVKEVLKLDGRINLCHLSTPEAVDLVRKAKEDGKQIYCEAALHHLFFNRNNVRNAYSKVNPPLRDESSQEGLLKRFVRGEVDFLTTDHAPHSAEEKERDIWSAPSGMTGLDDYGRVITWLMVERKVNPMNILRTSCTNPAEFLGLKRRGRVKKGNIADLTIINLKRPSKTRSEHLYTKCGWSPYEGIEFPGSVANTISKGNILSEYDEVYV